MYKKIICYGIDIKWKPKPRADELPLRDAYGRVLAKDYYSLHNIPVPTKAINYFVRSRIWLYAACLLPLCVLAAVAARLTLRRGRLRRICRMPAQEQLAEIYPAALNALEKCGLPAIGSSSPSEYCELHKNRISRILPDFAALTQAFERAFYGGIDPSGKEQTEYLALYRRLPSICQANVGMLRYTALFFRV